MSVQGLFGYDKFRQDRYGELVQGTVRCGRQVEVE